MFFANIQNAKLKLKSVNFSISTCNFINQQETSFQISLHSCHFDTLHILSTHCFRTHSLSWRGWLNRATGTDDLATVGKETQRIHLLPLTCQFSVKQKGYTLDSLLRERVVNRAHNRENGSLLLWSPSSDKCNEFGWFEDVWAVHSHAVVC